MNLYSMVGSGIGTHEATALSVRLASWHDAMVAHERRIRIGRADAICDDDCPHAEAHTLWTEALEVFGDRARELSFLRSRATPGNDSRDAVVSSSDVRSEAPGRGRRPNGSGQSVAIRRSRVFAESSDGSRTTTVEL
jgi:hypothetical protein